MATFKKNQFVTMGNGEGRIVQVLPDQRYVVMGRLGKCFVYQESELKPANTDGYWTKKAEHAD